MAIFTGNITYHMYQIIWLKFIMTPIQLTKEQMVLFRVYPKEPGFALRVAEAHLNYDNRKIDGKTPKFSLSPCYDSMSQHSSAEHSLNLSLSGVFSFGPNSDTTSNSWLYQGMSQTPKCSSSSQLASGYSLRKRVTPSRVNSDPIMSPKGLDVYLSNFEEQQVKLDEIARHESNSSLVGDHVSLSNLSNGGKSPTKYQAADDSVLVSSDQDMSVDSSSISPSRTRDSVSSRYN